MEFDMVIEALEEVAPKHPTCSSKVHKAHAPPLPAVAQERYVEKRNFSFYFSNSYADSAMMLEKIVGSCVHNENPLSKDTGNVQQHV